MVGEKVDFGELEDFESAKELKIVRRRVKIVGKGGRIFDGPSFPMDYQANFAYHSRMAGFVDVEAAADTIFSNPFHYGAGLFEGIKIHRTHFGDAFVELGHNIGRAIFSSMAFDRSLITQTMDLVKDPNVSHLTHMQRTPEEFFEDTHIALRNNEQITMGVTVHYKNGTNKQVRIPFRLLVRTDEEVREFSMREIEGAVFSLVMLNKLVRGGQYLSGIHSIPGGYVRLISWISGEEGLKVPTIMRKEDGSVIYKPLYLGIGTLPWGGRYLENDGGIEVLLAPLKRINESMPVSQKIVGNYVNSAQNVNLGILLGYGEIIALNHKKQLAEGSAENLIIVIKENGKYRAYVPPLSANVLAGTTRDRLNRILKKNLALENGEKIELVMEAPRKEMILDGLECQYLSASGAEKIRKRKVNYETVAIILMGTGAGLVHAKSITEIPSLKEWIKCDMLRSEESSPEEVQLFPLLKSTRKYIINAGEKHPVVSLLEREYEKFVLENEGKKLTMPYMMDPFSFSKIFGMQPSELLNGSERRNFEAKLESGYYQQRINGITHPDELKDRYRDWIRIVHKAAAISMTKNSLNVHSGMRT